MKITYDKKIDALYIQLKKGRYDHTKKVTDAILVDISDKEEILGLEILDASESIGAVPKKAVTIEQTTTSARPTPIS